MVTDLLPREAMDDYILSLGGIRARNTVLFHRSALRQLVNWMEAAGLALSDLRGRQFRQYLSYREETGASSTTRYHDAVCARCWLDYCRAEGYIHDNPLHGQKFKKPPHRLEYVPTTAEVKQLLAATLTRRRASLNPHARFSCQTDRTYYERWDHAMILGYIETACRLSELCKLLLADVDMAAGIVTFRDTKTNQDRAVPVSARWLEAVKKYLVVRPKGAPSPTLFVTSYGAAVKPGWMCRKIADYAAYAGVPRCTAQAIRRWRITQMAHSNILMAAVVAGNSVNVIRRHYLQPDMEKMREMMAQTLGAEPVKGGRGRKLI